MKLKRMIVLILFGGIMMCSLAVYPSAVADNFQSQSVFRTGGDSYFRIPTLVSTNDGSVFAFCNDRQTSVHDATPIQWISYSVAKDGVNFSEPVYILNREGWGYYIGSAVYDAVNDNIMLIYRAGIVTDAAKKIYNEMSEQEKAQNPVGAAIIESSDGGKNWSCRSIILPDSRVYPYKSLNVHGGSAGIQLKYGENAGRLLFAAKSTVTSEVSSVKEYAKGCVAMILFSDDYGKTWRASLNAMPAGTDESTLCEFPDGTVYLSSRMISNENARYIGYSYDGGKTLKDFRVDQSLEVLSEYGIKGAVINIPDYDGNQHSLTLFASLNTPSVARRNACVWISYDEGKTWPQKTVIDSGLAGYCEMIYNDVTEKISFMYERGDRDWYTDGIEIATFDINWLLQNAKENIPLRGASQLNEEIQAKIISDSMVVQLNDSGLNRFSEDGVWLNTAAGATVHGSSSAVLPKIKPDAIHEYPALAFDGNQKINIPAIHNLTGNLTYFVVFRSNTDIANGETLIKCNNSNGIRTVLGRSSMSVTSYFGPGVYEYVQGREFLDTSWHIVAVAWDGDSEQTATLTQFMDGNASLKYDIGKAVAGKQERSTGITLGNGFDGCIAEVLVYNKCLTDEEIASVGLALAEKYDLKWDLFEPKEGDDQNTPSGNPGITSGDVQTSDSPVMTDPAITKPEKKGCSSHLKGCGAWAVLMTVIGAVVTVVKKRRIRTGAKT